MLDHELLYRGEDIVKNRSTKKILLLGVGALGSWLLDVLARQGYSSITVLDKDRVESKNFGTQNYGRDDVGRMKALQCTAKTYIRLAVKVEPISKELDKNNARKLLRGYDLVVDMFDNTASRNICKTVCQELKVECLHVGMSHDGFSEIEWNDNYRILDAPEMVDDVGQPCEYPLASNLVHITVGLAAEVINQFIDDGKKKRVHFTLKDMHVHIF